MFAATFGSTLKRIAIGAIGAAATFVPLSTATAQGASPERRVALVIGIGAYKHATPLANPVTDARGVAASLRSIGFDVIESYDGDNMTLRRAVGDFSAAIETAKVALFYYAGHGMSVRDDNYLLPADAEMKREADLFQALKVRDVLEQMQRDQRTNIVILDACRDNPFAQRMARSMAGTRSASVRSGLAAMDIRSNTGTMIAFATDPGSVALDGDTGGNSPFTEALIRHAADPSINLSTVMDRVRSDVLRVTKNAQRPWTQSSVDGEIFLHTGTSRAITVQPKQVVAALPTVTSDAPPPVSPALPPLTAAPSSAELELKLWETAVKFDAITGYQAYLTQFPAGMFAGVARERVLQLQAKATQPPVAPLAPVAAVPPVAPVAALPATPVAPVAPVAPTGRVSAKPAPVVVEAPRQPRQRTRTVAPVEVEEAPVVRRAPPPPRRVIVERQVPRHAPMPMPRHRGDGGAGRILGAAIAVGIGAAILGGGFRR